MPQPAQPLPPPPPRTPGSRIIATAPDIVRVIAATRDQVNGNTTRIRRQDLTPAPADPAAGITVTASAFTPTHVAMAYRAGHAVYADLAMGTGTGSVMEARLTVPDLGLAGPATATGAGGTDVDLRVSLTLTDAWPVGEAHRVYVEARRVSGTDTTTVRVLAMWQR